MNEVSVNDIAKILFKTSNNNLSKYEEIELKKNLTTALGKCTDKSICIENLLKDEITDALKLVKNGNVAEMDSILHEFIKHLGLRGKNMVIILIIYNTYI